MIPDFPEFINLNVDLYSLVNQFTSKFEPYSDFNFISLYSWNIDNSAGISLLNENLVVRLPDYITGEPVYSLLGETNINESVKQLIDSFSELKLVPEIVIKSITDPNILYSEERDQFDYIYSLSDRSDLEGGKFKVERNKISKFLRSYGESLKIHKINFLSEKDRDAIKDILKNWKLNKEQEDIEARNETFAIERILSHAKQFNLMGILVYIDDKCAGFSINEILPDKFAICHFQKSLLTYEHIDVFISNISSKELKHMGCRYVNWEQDLGIEGLRKSKQTYSPTKFLKKYQVKSSSGT